MNRSVGLILFEGLKETWWVILLVLLIIISVVYFFKRFIKEELGEKQ